jgi:hypothetical protein
MPGGILCDDYEQFCIEMYAKPFSDKFSHAYYSDWSFAEVTDCSFVLQEADLSFSPNTSRPVLVDDNGLPLCLFTDEDVHVSDAIDLSCPSGHLVPTKDTADETAQTWINKLTECGADTDTMCVPRAASRTNIGEEAPQSQVLPSDMFCRVLAALSTVEATGIKISGQTSMKKYRFKGFRLPVFTGVPANGLGGVPVIPDQANECRQQ